MTQRTLFWHQTGPLMQYKDGLLRIENLNPQVETRWRMSRMEMLRVGLQFIGVALFPPAPKEGK